MCDDLLHSFNTLPQYFLCYTNSPFSCCFSNANAILSAILNSGFLPRSCWGCSNTSAAVGSDTPGAVAAFNGAVWGNICCKRGLFLTPVCFLLGRFTLAVITSFLCALYKVYKIIFSGLFTNTEQTVHHLF